MMARSIRLAMAWSGTAIALTACDRVLALDVPSVPSLRCLDDDFAELDLDAWSLQPSSSDIEIVDEAVHIRIPARTREYYGLFTNRAFDLTGGSVVVEVVQVVGQAYATENLLDVRDPRGTAYQIHVARNSIRFRDVVDDEHGDDFMRAFRPDAHRVWRIRHDPRQQQLVFGLGPDADHVEDLHRLPVLDVQALRIGLMAGAFDDTHPEQETAIFDNVEINGNCP